MILSICIPTYNRAECLARTLNLFAEQIKGENLYLSVEINVSDNGSEASTKNVVDTFLKANPRVICNYRRNETNMGPDENFIQAMCMAHGENSILWGDDDYLVEGGLRLIMKVIEDNQDAYIILTNRNLLSCDNNTYKQFFINSAVASREFDFSNDDQMISYFASVVCLGGALSFITSVIYKTIIMQQYPYDGSLEGTHYSFLLPWWSFLFNGNKLRYIDEVYVNSTVDTGVNHGKGINRVLLDYKGFIRVADRLGLSGFKREMFLNCVNSDHSIYQLTDLRLKYKEDFQKELAPLLEQCGKTKTELNALENSISRKQLLKNFVMALFPQLYSIKSRIR